MRPGQAAPEFIWDVIVIPPSNRCFNEAGAGCPGILQLTRIHRYCGLVLQ